MEPDLRDEAVDFVGKWSEKTERSARKLVGWLGIARSTYNDWKKRYGKVNEHNGLIPRDHWLEAWEKEAIVGFHLDHPDEGYRRLTYMMLDHDIVACSASSVYRVLQSAGLLARWNRTPSKKGTGFQQPLKPHEHWHTDISYINIHGTFYYLCSVLEGFSRQIIHWEIRESMTQAEVEIVLQRAREKFPDARPRIISDNGPQFIAKDFKEFIRISGMTHVRTSPYYPQSNGKLERFHGTLKSDCIRPGTPLNLEDARRIVEHFVIRYNTVRLHSAIGYITPKDKLEGRAEGIQAERERKLAAARQRRAQMRRASHENTLTHRKEENIIVTTGETDAGSAGGQPARDSRSGRRTTVVGESSDSPTPFSWRNRSDCPESPMPDKTPGAGAEPQDLVANKISDGRESLIGQRPLSNSR